MLFRLNKVCAALVLVLAASPFARGAEAADEARMELRRTPLVKLIEQTAPSAVDLYLTFTHPDGSQGSNVGSGVIVHEAGFILTSNGAANGEGRVQLFNGKSYPCRTLAQMPGENLAVVKIDADEPLTPITFGRSNDLMVGETVLIISNATGLPHTISTGIISRLVYTDNEKDTVGMIQTNAAVNMASEGAPLMNRRGELIGVVKEKAGGMENIGYALPVDRFCDTFADIVAAEKRYGFMLGVNVAGIGPAVVTGVVEGQPGAEAGLAVGDVVQSVGDVDVNRGIDFTLALLGREAGDVLPVTVVRDGHPTILSVTLRELPTEPAVDGEGMVNGLDFSTYAGQWNALPDFNSLTPEDTGRTDDFAIDVYTKGTDNFAIRFSGFIDVPVDGAYMFYTASDDGSRLYVNDKLVVDNDGLHATVEKSGSMRLAAGKHPITVEFFEQGGGEGLLVSYEGPGIDKQAIPASVLFVRPE